MRLKTLRLLIREMIETNSSPTISSVIGKGIVVACYTDSDFAGKAVAAVVSKMGMNVDRDESRNPKGWWTGNVPQGHAFAVLVNPADMSVVRCDFGQESCDYTALDSTQQKIAVWLAKTGVPFMSSTKVTVKSLGNLAKDARLSNLREMIVSNEPRTKEMIAVKNVDYSKCLNAAGANGSCRPYNLIPITSEVLTIMTLVPGFSSIVPYLRVSDNCGSYVARIVSSGAGAQINLESMKVSPGLIVQGISQAIPDRSIKI
jgi:hypothetical protein